MDAWLKTHAVEILPIAGAFYMNGCDRHRLAGTRHGLVLMLHGIQEGYKVLRALGVPITPSNHKIINWLPEPILVFIMRHRLLDEMTELKVGHANNARDEMKQIADEFRTLAQKTSVPTPAMDRLYQYINQAV